MPIKETIVTREGLTKLQEELDQLKTVKRKEVAEKIKVARSFGDLSENSEYDEAKNEQAFVEDRIMQIEATLKNIRVVDDEDIDTSRVGIGSKVLVHDMAYDEDDTYWIVGSSEIAPKEGKISDESPIGKALLGAKKNEIVTVEAPAGNIQLKILEITK